jgi:uncharacterized membrane protein YdbT with pleckstrin-like domain
MPDVYNAKAKKRSAIPKMLAETEPAMHALASYCPRPLGVGFDLQHEDEQVLLMIRQHPIVNIPWIVITILLTIAPFVFLPLVPILSFFPVKFHVIAFIGWYLMVFGYALEQFLVWFFNIYIITDERVIDMDFYNLLFKRVSEAKIDRIEDITTANSGLLQSIVDFGDIQIQTSAEIPEIEFEKIPHPDRVQKLLSELIDQEEQERIEGRVK